MKKKIMAMVLAMSMIAGTALSVNAAATTTEAAAGSSGIYEHSLTSDSTVKAPTVKITVPTTAATVIVNPYGIECTLGEETGVTDQIISAEQSITSKSDVPVKVEVSLLLAKTQAATTAKSNVVITTKTGIANLTTKAIYMQMLFSATESDYTTTVAALDFGTKAANADVTTLAVDTEDGTTIYFKIDGGLVAEPSTTPWNANDSVAATYKFTFTPLKNTEVSGG